MKTLCFGIFIGSLAAPFLVQAKNEFPEELKERLAANDFTINRRLYSEQARGENTPDDTYEMILGARLLPTLKGLGPESIWFDMGAGEANAQMQFFKDATFPKIQKAVALSFSRPSSAVLDAFVKENAGRFEYVANGYIEDVYKSGQLQAYKARVSVITDVFGPGSYSPHLDEVMQIYLELLAVGGKLHMNIPMGYFGSSPFLCTEFCETLGIPKDDDFGSDPSGWLAGIKGVKVIALEMTGLNDQSWAVTLEKIRSVALVPKLKLEKFEAKHSPPGRRYQILK